MDTKTIKLEQDAGRNCIKRTVQIKKETLAHELKNHFRWRKGDFVERFFKLGTSDYDGFIQNLIDKGYPEVK